MLGHSGAWALLLLALLGRPGPVRAADASRETVPDFRLVDERGVPHELYRYADRKAVVIIAQVNGCPIIEKYSPDIRALGARFAASGVSLFLLNPSDDSEAAARYARRFEPGAPILLDDSGSVASLLRFERTAEAVVIDPRGWRIVYRGAIDDSLYYGGQKAATHAYLADALEAFLANRPVPATQTRAMGCLLNLGRPRAVSYVREAAPVLSAHCLRCHAREDGPAPMRRYEDVVKWGPMIRETLLTMSMPLAAPGWRSGPFLTSAGLRPEERRALIGWIEAGTPRGEGADPLPAAVVSANDRERKGAAPDLVLSMKQPESLRASGLEPYRYILLADGFPDDFDAAGVVVRHADPNLVHHEILYVFPPGVALPRLGAADSDRVARVMPGQVPSLTPWEPSPSSDLVQRIPKGSRLVLEIHYRTLGRPASDLARVELYRYRGKHPHRLRTLFVQNTRFRIPPGAPDYEVLARRKITRPCQARGFFIHMHGRGDHATMSARYPDGRVETLISLPRYDPMRPIIYALKQPKPLPVGTVLELAGGFDNSRANPANPDPTREAAVGMRVDDEMLFSACYVTDGLR